MLKKSQTFKLEYQKLMLKPKELGRDDVSYCRSYSNFLLLVQAAEQLFKKNLILEVPESSQK